MNNYCQIKLQRAYFDVEYQHVQTHYNEQWHFSYDSQCWGVTCVSMERGMWSREGWRCAGCYDQTLSVACPTAERQNNRQMIRQVRWTGAPEGRSCRTAFGQGGKSRYLGRYFKALSVLVVTLQSSERAGPKGTLSATSVLIPWKQFKNCISCCTGH